MIRKLRDIIERKKDIINRYVPLFLLIYFIIISTPYLFAWNTALNSFFTHSIAFNIIRLLAIGSYAMYGCLLMISNRLRINWILVIGMILLLILMIVNSIMSPSSIVYYSFYFTGKIAISNISVGVYTHLLHIARFIGDMISLFFLVCAYPYSFKNRNQFTYVVLPSIIIAVVGVFYTLLFERNAINQVLNGGNPELITSIFHSKNAYGIFLFNGAVAATFIFFSDSRKWSKFLAITVPFFIVMAFLINCKLVAVCIMILLILAFIYAVIKYFKTKPYISFLLLGLSIIVSAAVVLIFSLPQLRSIDLISKVYDKIIDSITSFDISSFIGRTREWKLVPRMTRGIYSLIGFSTATGYQLITAYTSINGTTGASVYDLHNAYVDFYAYHGIVGCILLGLFYLYTFYLIYKLFKKSKEIALLEIMIFIVSILFGMAETYRLFLSMSANTFTLNTVLLGVLLFELKGDKTVFRPNISLRRKCVDSKEMLNE